VGKSPVSGIQPSAKLISVAYGIRGMTTIQKWIKKYGMEELLPKRGRVETIAGVDEVKGGEKRE
jgi:hypothetical protein